jgi:hypothetical protein
MLHFFLTFFLAEILCGRDANAQQDLRNGAREFRISIWRKPLVEVKPERFAKEHYHTRRKSFVPLRLRGSKNCYRRLIKMPFTSPGL